MKITLQKLLGPNAVIEEQPTVPPRETPVEKVPPFKNETPVKHTSETGGVSGDATPHSVAHEESDGLHADPIYNDMNYISKMFPDIDKNEIYAYLEAHFDKKNRVQIVTDELLGADEDSQGPLKVKSVIDLTNSHSTVTPKGKNDPELGVSDVEKDVIAITAVVPDCDPNFLYEGLEKKRQLL